MTENIFELFKAISYTIDKKEIKLHHFYNVYHLNRKNPSHHCCMRKKVHKYVLYDPI